MSDQAVTKTDFTWRRALAWFTAAVGLVVAALTYSGILAGYVFSLLLSEQPPSGVTGLIKVAIGFLAFACLPILAAWALARMANRRGTSDSVTTAIAFWSVSAASLLCIAGYWVAWEVLP